jgi:hypothetical protein
MKNSFTDPLPAFAYQSSEARRELGIPDSPAIHLAITALAERLIPLAQGASASVAVVRIGALRCASYGTLMCLPFECVVFRYQTRLELPADKDSSDAAYNAGRTDWLELAAAQLRNEGIDVPATVAGQRSRYGWLRRDPS